VHDYRSALQTALSWLGDRYLLAQPVNRVSAHGRPNFAETRQWMPDTRH
jgi:RecB family endonuclease NucS